MIARLSPALQLMYLGGERRVDSFQDLRAYRQAQAEGKIK